jgi:sec-independent protein translocase protein TatC
MSEATRELDAGNELSEPEDESGKMSFLEHLDELRRRLVHTAIYLAIGFAACWSFREIIYNFLSAPITPFLPPNTKLAYTTPTAPFTLYMKVAFLGGIFLTIPLTLYEVWKFIAPGLYKKEKRYVIPFLFSSVLLFLSGAAFCYVIVLPAVYRFLINLGSAFTPVIKIDEYLTLTMRMILGFGMIFEMPVIVAFLSIFGLVTANFLWTKFKYAIILIFAAAALISPTGDAFNLIIWATPMVLLYIISIGIAAIFGRRRKAKGLA